MDHLDLGCAPFSVMANPHDFGTYYSVAVHFDPNDADAVAYACRCDDEAPDQWDMAARSELEAARQQERDATVPARAAR